MFQVIVACISNDYVACDRIKDRNDPYMGAKLSLLHSRAFHGDDHEFLRVARRYLRALGDPNLALIKRGSDARRDWDIGFRVRAARDCLYVSEVWADDRVHVGDRIVSVGGSPLDHFRQRNDRNILYGQIPERELWDYYLQYAASFELANESCAAPISLRPLHNPISTRPRPDRVGFVRDIASKASDTSRASGQVCGAYFCLERLDNAAALQQLLEDNRELLSNAQNLILDLRTCSGGSYDALEVLFEYLIDAEQSFSEFIGELGLMYRYSHGNCERFMQSARLEAAREGRTPDELEAELKHLEALKGTGLVWEDALLPDAWIEARAPKTSFDHVVVLEDLYTRDMAELLLKALVGRPKTTLVGRASLGASDYQELCSIDFDNDILFVYPCAMTRDAFEGRGMLGVGVVPDVYVAWSPDELVRDVVLDEACATLA